MCFANLKFNQLAILVLSCSALLLAKVSLADGKETVQVFYDFLSNPGSQEHAVALKGAVADDCESIGDYSGKNKTFAGSARGLHSGWSVSCRLAGTFVVEGAGYAAL